jgi:predicted metal-dependent hydrolase
MLQVDDVAVEITVRRVRRMNLGVHPPDGRVRVSVPARTSDRSVARFVRESRAWIERHRQRICEDERAAALLPPPPVRIGADGELWSRLGEPLRLEVVVAPGARPKVIEHPDRRLEVQVHDPADRAVVLRALDRWQRRELRAVAEPLLDRWCERVGVDYEFLGLRRMSTRWGSCVPSRGRIWLNLALLDHSHDLLEYVVVHEVVHLREASHGPRFRSLMDRHLPDWPERRRRLDADARPVHALS